MAIYLNRLVSPSPKASLSQVCLKIDQVILEKNMEVNDNDDKTDNDDGQISIRKAR